jgi:hypothetical protein
MFDRRERIRQSDFTQENYAVNRCCGYRHSQKYGNTVLSVLKDKDAEIPSPAHL